MTAKPQITADKLLATEADPALLRLAQRRSKHATKAERLAQRQKFAPLLRTYMPTERKH